MVSQKYRWDFIGLSTDDKPTSETSDKVVNGSTYYCSDTSKLYVYCDGTWYERKPLGGGGGGGTSDFNDLSNRPKYNGSDMTGSTNIPEVKIYTAGSNVAISDQNVISATDTTYTAGTNVSISDQNVISATDTTYSAFTGTDGTAAGTSGLVPAPATTDAGKFLKADGTWDTAGGGGGSSVNVVQTTGTSTTDVMSQNATTSMVFADPATQQKIKIGAGTSSSEGENAIEIGYNASANGQYSVAMGFESAANPSSAVGIGGRANAYGSSSTAVGYAATGYGGSSTALGSSATVNLGISAGSAIGFGATSSHNGSVALGAYSTTSGVGQVNIGSTQTNYGYNNSSYRLLTGLYDPQSAHDATTKGYVDPSTDSSVPTTATVGRLGQIQIDTTNNDAYMCVAVDDVTPAYTWKKITV